MVDHVVDVGIGSGQLYVMPLVALRGLSLCFFPGTTGLKIKIFGVVEIVLPRDGQAPSDLHEDRGNM